MAYVSIKGYMSSLTGTRLKEKNTVYLSSDISLNEDYLNILTNSMLQTYTSDIEERIIL